MKEFGFFSACLTVFALSAASFAPGSWEGDLTINGAMTLPIVFNVGEDGALTLDSPAQGAFGLPGRKIFASADSISVNFFTLGARLSGRLIEENSQPALRAVFSQGGRTFNLMMTPRCTTEEEAALPYSVSDFAVTNGDVILSGTLCAPEGIEDFPLAVMITGSGLQTRDEQIGRHKPFSVIADSLARRGIASFRYDDRGCGASTGNGLTATTTDFASDAHAVVDSLRTKGLTTGPIGVIGHSEGGRIAFGLDNVDFVIALAGNAVRGDSILFDQQKIIGIADDAVIAEEARMYDMIRAGETPSPAEGSYLEAVYRQIESSPWLKAFISDSPADDLKAMEKRSVPVLALFGDRDMQVRPELNVPTLQLLAPSAKIVIMPGLNHLLQPCTTGMPDEYTTIEEAIAPEAIEVMADFIDKVRTTHP